MMADADHLRSGEAGGDASRAPHRFSGRRTGVRRIDLYDPRPAVSLSGRAVHYARIAVGPHGHRGLDAHRGRPAHYFDEEGQCPRASALFTQTWLSSTPMKFSPRNTRIFRS